MRYILLTRGIPGSGKSTWLKNQGLEPYTISPDQIRLLFSAPVMNSSGKFGINQKMNKRVWDFVYQLVDERMDKGELIVVDATHKKAGDFQKYQELAKKYLYKIGCVDFSDLPLDICLRQNRQREEYKRVPDSVVEKHYQTISTSSLPKSIIKINPNSQEDLNDFFKEANKIHKLEATKVHLIGDVQGSFEPLKEYFKDGFKDDEFYIFTGDFLDRGIQNGEVLEWTIQNLIDRKNVILIMGNHERHLVKWASDIPAKIPDLEFESNTLPQILKKKIFKQDVYRLVSKMLDVYRFEFAGQEFIVSHAGLGKIPANLERITSKQFWNALGAYGEPIDEIFHVNEPEKFQVHGHRNTRDLPVQAFPNSCNLEGKIEFGGALRIVIFEYQAGKQLTGLKVTPVEIKNDIYNRELIPKKVI